MLHEKQPGPVVVTGEQPDGSRVPTRSGKGGWRAVVIRWGVILGIFIAGSWYMTIMPGTSWSGPIPPLTAEEQLIRDGLQRHVAELAANIGERNVWHPGALAAAADYIRTTLEGSGYTVEAQPFASRELTVHNLVAELPGSGSTGEIVIVGAHYDTVIGTPGANDNGSGIAALLEIARLLGGEALPSTVRFVAFVNEEAPFFYSNEMGSYVYASRAREQGEPIRAMLSLETIGYYTDEPASQHYPFPFSYFYPDTGNFIGFVGNLSSRRLVRQAVAAFRASTPFPSEGVAAPGWMGGIHWSDHWSFWKNGYPALMVTDTALYRYPYYHAGGDTPEKLDYTGFARVTGGLAKVVAAIAAE